MYNFVIWNYYTGVHRFTIRTCKQVKDINVKDLSQYQQKPRNAIVSSVNIKEKLEFSTETIVTILTY